MHEADGDGVYSAFISVGQYGTGFFFVQWRQDCAFCTDAFVHFGAALEQHVGLADFEPKEVRAVLVSDPQGILETSCCQEKDPLALPFANAVKCRIDILFGVFRKQLMCGQSAIRLAHNNVGKCAAAINPEVPARFFRGFLCHGNEIGTCGKGGRGETAKPVCGLICGGKSRRYGGICMNSPTVVKLSKAFADLPSAAKSKWH